VFGSAGRLGRRGVLLNFSLPIHFWAAKIADAIKAKAPAKIKPKIRKDGSDTVHV
jgi:hypothetical protein